MRREPVLLQIGKLDEDEGVGVGQEGWDLGQERMTRTGDLAGISVGVFRQRRPQP